MFKRNLRHSSLHPELNAMSGKFQWLKQIIKLRLNNLFFSKYGYLHLNPNLLY